MTAALAWIKFFVHQFGNVATTIVALFLGISLGGFLLIQLLNLRTNGQVGFKLLGGAVFSLGIMLFLGSYYTEHLFYRVSDPFFREIESTISVNLSTMGIENRQIPVHQLNATIDTLNMSLEEALTIVPSPMHSLIRTAVQNLSLTQGTARLTAGKRFISVQDIGKFIQDEAAACLVLPSLVLRMLGGIWSVVMLLVFTDVIHKRDIRQRATDEAEKRGEILF